MNSSTALARSITKQLIEAGITDVVLSPGSRNAPLSIALHQSEIHGLLKLHVRIDERGAAFFALGIAKASKRPVAIICTSGTAVANYHPAVLEAHHSQVPLIILSADRPARLRHTGANQTTLQDNFFGASVEYSADISDDQFDCSKAFGKLIEGPIHLNLQFDEPLLPDDDSEWLTGISRGTYSEPSFNSTAQLTIANKRGVIVIGHDRGSFSVTEISNFVRQVGWPVISEDPLSFPESITYASLLLTSGKIRKELLPEVVIVIGRTTLSRSINALVKSADHEIVVDARINSVDNKRTADQLFSEIPTVINNTEQDHGWRELWLKKSAMVNSMLPTLPQWCEENIARALAAILPARSPLFISSSRPIRDIEGFASARADIETFANRGLAGIDGNDMGALISIEDFNLRLVVVNNDGGGIFSTLPQNSVEGFEKIFGTPHGRDVAAIAQAMGIASTTVSTMEDFVTAISAPIKGVSVVVALVPSREKNSEILKDFYRAIDLG